MFDRFDDEALAAVQATHAEAIGLGHNYIGTEHLILGIINHLDTTAARLLAAHGVGTAVMRHGIAEALPIPDRPFRDPAPLLSTLGIDLDEVRRRAEITFGPDTVRRVALRQAQRRHWWLRSRRCVPIGPSPLGVDALGFTPRAKHTLKRAAKEADRRDQPVTPTHLLLGRRRRHRRPRRVARHRRAARPSCHRPHAWRPRRCRRRLGPRPSPLSPARPRPVLPVRLHSPGRTRPRPPPREAGQIAPAEDFDDDHRHLDLDTALRELERLQPDGEDLVVCHGDYCPPNALITDGHVTGYIDLGELGVADRWWDLAVATRAVTGNYGHGLEDLFLDTYGTRPDPRRQAFYRLLYDLAS